jgi:hypothetical protein
MWACIQNCPPAVVGAQRIMALAPPPPSCIAWPACCLQKHKKCMHLQHCTNRHQDSSMDLAARPRRLQLYTRVC